MLHYHQLPFASVAPVWLVTCCERERTCCEVVRICHEVAGKYYDGAAACYEGVGTCYEGVVACYEGVGTCYERVVVCYQGAGTCYDGRLFQNPRQLEQFFCDHVLVQWQEHWRADHELLLSSGPRCGEVGLLENFQHSSETQGQSGDAERWVLAHLATWAAFPVPAVE